jgi:hypothetical protein
VCGKKADSSIVTILSNIARDHRQKLLASPHPSSRLLNKPNVSEEDGMDSLNWSPLAKAMFLKMICRSASMAAVTEAMTAGILVLFFRLRYLRSAVFSPAFTSSR